MTATTWAIWAGYVLAAYIVGSVPFAYLLGRSQGVDIRTVGSGNVGATNLGRTLGKKWGIGCFLLDVAKGTAVVLVWSLLEPWAKAGGGMGGIDPAEAGAASINSTTVALLTLGIAISAVAGHCLPVWLNFKGGKGVATGLGAMLGVYPILTLPGAAGFVVWLIVTGVTRYVSVASMTGAATVPVFVAGYAWYTDMPTSAAAVYISVTALLAVFVVYRHRSNIARLARGEESKLGQKKSTAKESQTRQESPDA